MILGTILIKVLESAKKQGSKMAQNSQDVKLQSPLTVDQSQCDKPEQGQPGENALLHASQNLEQNKVSHDQGGKPVDVLSDERKSHLVNETNWYSQSENETDAARSVGSQSEDAEDNEENENSYDKETAFLHTLATLLPTKAEEGSLDDQSLSSAGSPTESEKSKSDNSARENGMDTNSEGMEIEADSNPQSINIHAVMEMFRELRKDRKYCLSGLKVDGNLKKWQNILDISSFLSDSLQMEVVVDDYFSLGDLEQRQTVLIFQTIEERRQIFRFKNMLKGIQHQGREVIISDYLPPAALDKKKRERDIFTMYENSQT